MSVAQPSLAPRLAFDAGERVVFASDVHLYFGGEAYLEQFLERLREAARGARAVFLHGDLFDFYVGPRQGRQPFYAPLFAAIRELVRSGVQVAVQHGNRDFLMGRCFEDAGAALLPDEVALRLGGLDVHLSHGDQFCVHDRSYQFWARGVLRARPAKAVVRSLPVPVAVWLARRYRSVSRRKMARMNAAGGSRLSTVFDGVRLLLAAKRFDAVICGHIHDLAVTPFSAPGRETLLYTTGAWEDGPNWIAFEGGALVPHGIGRRAGADTVAGPAGSAPS